MTQSDSSRSFIRHVGKWLYWNGKLYYLREPRLLRQWYKFHKPRKKFGITAPFIIYQMSKVGSSTIVRSLGALDLDVPLYHIHFLNDFDSIERSTRTSQANPRAGLEVIAQGRALRGEIEKHPTRQWNIVCLVRLPIARDVSSFFQGIDAYLPNAQTRFQNGTLTLPEIETIFLENHFHHTDEYWFDTQVKPVFGIDVYATPFPQERGYTIYRGRNARLLLIRLEDLNRVAKVAFREAFHLPHLQLARANVGAEKDYQEIYHAFRERAQLPQTYLDAMITSRYARHFYSAAELERDRAAWTRAAVAPFAA